jgi:hypothetical protein
MKLKNLPVGLLKKVPIGLNTLHAVLRIRDVYPGSRILIFTHPGSRISDPGFRIPEPKTATKERGEKKLVVIPFYQCSGSGSESGSTCFWASQIRIRIH